MILIKLWQNQKIEIHKEYLETLQQARKSESENRKNNFRTNAKYHNYCGDLVFHWSQHNIY